MQPWQRTLAGKKSFHNTKQDIEQIIKDALKDFEEGYVNDAVIKLRLAISKIEAGAEESRTAVGSDLKEPLRSS